MNLPKVNFAILLVVLLTACTRNAPSEDAGGGNMGNGPIATEVAQIATNQSHIATQVGRLGDSIQQMEADKEQQEEIISYMLTQMPTPQLFLQEGVTVTPTPYVPVTGSVLVEGGRCCAGGTVGEVIDVQVGFEAVSFFGEVVEMRVVTGYTLDTQAIAASPWEPYQREKTYPVEVQTANWLGWWVVVQYRDEAGNVSPIYFDDISIEGMPGAPTPTQIVN